MQIAESVAGRRRIVRHVGSAHDETELGVLVEEARRLLSDDAQGVLDLGITPAVPKATMLTPATPGSPQAGLFTTEGTGPVDARRGRRVAAPRVLKTSSALLYETLAGVYASLGFDVVGDEVFRDLVIARVVEPTSLLDIDRVLADLGRVSASLSTRKRTLRRAQAGTYRDQIASACFTHTLSHGDVSLVLYDVTTLYFEAENEDDLRKVGYSKERRVDPQIVVGLLVDRTGFPLEIGCFEGDTAETTTMVPTIGAFPARHDLAHMVVVADAGMLSAANPTAFEEAGLRFIVGSRATRRRPIWSPTSAGTATPSRAVRSSTPSPPRPAPNDRERPQPQDRTGLGPRPAPRHRGARCGPTPPNARARQPNADAQENRAREVVEGEKSARTPRFVKTSNGTECLDEACLARAQRLVGLKGYVTNMPAAGMPAKEIIARYHDLWHVEKSFRMFKSDLASPAHVRPHPRRHRSPPDHRVHRLGREPQVQNRTGLSIRHVIRQLRPLRSATVTINGITTTIPPQRSPDVTSVLDAINTPPARH